MPRSSKPKVQDTGQLAFVIRFTGEGMSPKTIRLGELAEVLRSIEDVLAAIMGLPSDELFLGLIGVKDASAGYACALPSRDAERALDTWAQAIETSDFSNVPEAAIDPSRKILTFVRKKNCRAEISKVNARKPLAQMTPDTVIGTFRREPLTGITTIYGYCQRVGGADPKMWLRLVDSSAVSLDIASEELARKVGQRLYQWIGVNGLAKWHPETRQLMAFRVDAIVPYEGPSNSGNGLAAIAALIGPSIEGLTGTDIAELRN